MPDSSIHLLNNIINRLKKSTHLLMLAILSLLWIIFFWRLFTPTTADRLTFIQGDFTVHYFPFSSYQAERVSDGDIPLWNPYNNAGGPFAADPQSVAFYPPRLLSIFLASDNWSQANLRNEVAFHYLLTSVLMYVFLYKLADSEFAAVSGSVIFTYGGYLTAYPMLQVTVLYSTTWLPLILLGIHLSFSEKAWNIRGVVLGAIGLGLSILGGHPQTILYIGYISLAYFLFMTYHNQHSLTIIVFRGMVLYGLGLLIALVQIWPSVEFVNLSARVEQYTYIDKASGFAIADSLQIIFPTFFGIWSPLYVGVAGFLLALGAIFRQNVMNIFWAILTLLSLLISFGKNSIFYDVFYLFVPGVSTFRQQERLALGVTFGLAVLATYQIAWLISNQQATDEEESSTPDFTQQSNMRRISILHVGTIVTMTLILVSQRLLNNDPPVDDTTNTFVLLSLTSILFLGWLHWQVQQRPTQTLATSALLILIVMDLFVLSSHRANWVADTPENQIAEPVALAELAVPSSDDIVWRVDGAGGLQDRGTYFRVPDIYGASPLYLEKLEVLRQLPVDRFWELLAVRYVMTTDDMPADIDATLIAEGINYDEIPYQVYELNNPYPFAQLIYAHILGHNTDFTNSLLADPSVDLRETVITHGYLPIELSGERSTDANIQNIQFESPENLRMNVNTSENAILTISILNYPGWQVEVDGKSVEIIEVNNGLIGIPLEGKDKQQNVQLRFVPQSVRIGGIVSVLTSVLSLAYLVGTGLNNYRYASNAM